MGELGLLTVGTCSEQGGKVKKMERKMLELRNTENVIHVDLEITKTIGTMTFHKCCCCFIIIICVKNYMNSQTLSIYWFAFSYIYSSTEEQNPRLLDKVKIFAILVWVILLFLSIVDFVHRVSYIQGILPSHARFWSQTIIHFLNIIMNLLWESAYLVIYNGYNMSIVLVCHKYSHCFQNFLPSLLLFVYVCMIKLLNVRSILLTNF